MAKKIVGFVKLQVPAGKANPSPPIGPALGQRGLNIMEFCKAFNAQTQGVEPGLPLPVVITAFADKSFTFVIKTPPATILIKKAIKLDKGSATSAQGQGRQDHARSARRNRQDQDERHDRCRSGCCRSYHRRFCPLDGRECGGRVNVQADQKTKDLAGKVDSNKLYPLADALGLVKECATAKFDESIDVAVQLGIDAKKSDQVVRGAVVLPNGTGKTKRVAVFAQGAKAEEAKAAGADIVGMDDLAAMVKAGDMPFDVVIAAPDAMRVVGTLGQILGPRGLMPNPKVGTVTPDVATAVQQRQGRSGAVPCRQGRYRALHHWSSLVRHRQAAGQLGCIGRCVEQGQASYQQGCVLEQGGGFVSTMGVGVRVDTPNHRARNCEEIRAILKGLPDVVGCVALQGAGRPSKTVGVQATRCCDLIVTSQRRWRSRCRWNRFLKQLVAAMWRARMAVSCSKAHLEGVDLES